MFLTSILCTYIFKTAWKPDDNPSFYVVSVPLSGLSNSRQHTKGKAVAAEISEQFQVEKEMCWEDVPTFLDLFIQLSPLFPNK